MYVSDLALDDFRSYAHEVIRFSPGTTVIVGANGQGKTNLVEAIGYLAHLTSHRVGADTALVRVPQPGSPVAPGAVIRAKVHTGGRDQILELEILRGRPNRARLNRNPVRPRQLVGILKTVTFSPEDLTIVTGDPSGRRRLLDETAAQRWREYASLKSDMDRILRQRGALLKQLGKQRRMRLPVDTSTLAVWNEQFVIVAERIVDYRVRLVDELRSPARDAYCALSEGARELGIEYENSAPYLAAALTEFEDREIDRGVNLVGPHRDDLQLSLDHLPVRGYASHGESWSVALALKLAAFDALSAPRGIDEVDTPLLILDDVFAELDAKRREALVTAIRGAEQILITAAVEEDVPQMGEHVLRVKLRNDRTSRVLSREEGVDDIDESV